MSWTNQYLGGVPASLINYSTERGIYAARDGVYDIPSDYQAQLNSINEQISTLNQTLIDLKTSQSIQTLADSNNLAANGDCSQWSLPYMLLPFCTESSNFSFIIQSRVHLIMDRWYLACELAGLNPNGLVLNVKRATISDFTGGLEVGTYPLNAKYGCYLEFGGAHSPQVLTPEHTVASPNASKVGGLLAIQHRIENVAQFSLRKVYVGFWVRANRTTKGFVRLVRQYNWTKGGNVYSTSAAIDIVGIQNFSMSNDTWTYISLEFNVPLLRANSIVDGENGLIVQIGPFFYNFTSANSSTLYGDLAQFTVSDVNMNWVITEIQVRTDTAPTQTNFTVNLREHERTLPWISPVMLLPQSVIYNRPPANVNDTFYLASGSAYVYAGSGSSNLSLRATFQLNYPTEMIRTPSRAYLCNYHVNDPKWIRVGAIFYNNDTCTGNYVYGRFGYAEFKGAYVRTYCNSGSVRNDEVYTARMRSYGVQNAIYEADYDVYGSTYSSPTTADLTMASHGESCFGWFVFHVPEFDSGYTNNNYTYSYLDYSYSSMSTIPILSN